MRHKSFSRGIYQKRHYDVINHEISIMTHNMQKLKSPILVVGRGCRVNLLVGVGGVDHGGAALAAVQAEPQATSENGAPWGVGRGAFEETGPLLQVWPLVEGAKRNWRHGHLRVPTTAKNCRSKFVLMGGKIPRFGRVDHGWQFTTGLPDRVPRPGHLAGRLLGLVNARVGDDATRKAKSAKENYHWLGRHYTR